jgi:hypothetical protein
LFDAGIVDREGRRLFLVDDDAAEDEGISVVDLRSGDVIARLDEQAVASIGAEPLALYPTPDGTFVDVTWSDGQLRRLDAGTLDVEAEVRPPFIIQGRVASDPRSDTVFMAGWTGGIGRVGLATGDETWGRSTDPTILANATLSPDGSVVAGVHAFSTSIALFDAQSLRPLGRPIPIGSGTGVFAFTPDGDLLVNGPFGVSRIELDPDEWQAAACRVAGRNLTAAEWAEFFGDEPYRATCPDQASA